MKILKSFLCVSLCVAATASAATVSGNVAFVTKRGQNPDKSQTLVWLEPLSPMKIAKNDAFQMTTRGKTLLPHVIAVPVGSSVQFPNDDPIIHNLFSVSAPNAFDLGLYKKGAGKTQTFSKPGVVNVYCNVHPNMSAVIHVMDTPFYTFADAQGTFKLENVQPGKYRLMAWNEQAGNSSVDLEVKGDVSAAKVTLDARNVRLSPHLNKFNQPYARSRSNDY